MHGCMHTVMHLRLTVMDGMKKCDFKNLFMKLIVMTITQCTYEC